MPGPREFIKTVARRGYRFIAPVARVDVGGAAQRNRRPPDATATDASAQTIAVMDFTNVTGDPDSAWLSAGIAETVTGDLRALGRFRVVDRGRVIEAIRRTERIAARGVRRSRRTARRRRQLSAQRRSHPHHGAYRERAEAARRWPTPRSTASLADIFELQDQVVAQFSKELGMCGRPSSRRAASRETPSLEAYRAFTEGWLQLETLDVREIPQADRRLRARDQHRSSLRARLHRPRERGAGGVRRDTVRQRAGAGPAERARSLTRDER